jgi:hypothetical protein
MDIYGSEPWVLTVGWPSELLMELVKQMPKPSQAN